MSSPDDRERKELLVALINRWGDDQRDWLPSQSLLRYKSVAEWPPRVIKALSHLAVRTRTVQNRDLVVAQLKETTYTSLHLSEFGSNQSLTTEQEAHQLCLDIECLLASLKPHLDAFDQLTKHWGEDIGSGLPWSATPDGPTLIWDVKLLRCMADFAAAYPNAGRVMREYFVVGTIKDREEKNGDASRKATVVDFERARAHFEKSRHNGVLNDLEDIIAELDEEEAAERRALGIGLPERYVAELLAVPWDESVEDNLQLLLDRSMARKVQLSDDDAARTAGRKARHNHGMITNVEASDTGQNDTSDYTAGGRRGRGAVRRTPVAHPQGRKEARRTL